jgi:hypothetical protein
MRTRQNSASSTIPKLGISRGVPADASSIGILSDQRESKGLSHHSPLRHQPSQLLIANLELEFHLTAAKPITCNFLIANFRRFFIIVSRAWARVVSLAQSRLPAREGSLITTLPWPPPGGRLIETPRLKFPVTPTTTPQYKILIGTKTALLIRPCWLVSPSCCARESRPHTNMPENSRPTTRRS